MKKNFTYMLLLFLFSTLALADQQIFTEYYELSIPDYAHYHEAGDSYEGVVESLKVDISYIVDHATQLNHFPVPPQKVLLKVEFQKPVIHIVSSGVDIFVFTVDVPVPDLIRNALLKRWFSIDVKAESENGYFVRLHKERGGAKSDVGIIIARAPFPSDLESQEINNIINSFSTF